MARRSFVRIRKNELGRLRRMVDAEANRILRGAASHGVTIAQTSMEESPATGQVYTRGTVTHVASAPGQPPRMDIGTLWAAMRWEQRRTLVLAIIAGTNYGEYLEFGTDRMAPRPFMGPMAVELAEELPSMFNDFLEDK